MRLLRCFFAFNAMNLRRMGVDKASLCIYEKMSVSIFEVMSVALRRAKPNMKEDNQPQIGVSTTDRTQPF